MSKSSSPPTAPEQEQRDAITSTAPASKEAGASYVKLAMRNMVRKGGKSLQHFFLTTVGLLAVLVGLAYLTH